MRIPKLGVNIDHVATVRQARRTYEPDPVAAAALATLAGAEVITCHLREDRRHVNDRDLALLKATVTSKLNLEMASAPAIVRIALRTRPEQVTLVPEKRAEVTTEGGLNVRGGGKPLADAVRRLKSKGIIVSLFIDPDPDQIAASAEIGADAVELHTGAYANARREAALRRELRALLRGAEEARRLKLRLNAGHGLNYVNIRDLLEQVHGIEELHIGHSLVSRAVLVGMERAVREMVELIVRYTAR
jgi:pyridoxine 5-phosphate synthase